MTSLKSFFTDSNFIVYVVMGPKCSNSSISMRVSKLLQPQFHKNLTKKSTFWGMLLAPSFETGTRCDLEILHQCRKRVKTKRWRVFGANSYVWRNNRREKLNIEAGMWLNSTVNIFHNLNWICSPNKWVGPNLKYFTK